MSMENAPQSRWLIFGLLFIFSLLFHSYHLDFASYDLDEAVHIWHAQKSYSEVIAQSAEDPNPPVYNLILSAWVKQFGVSEWTTRFFSALMGALGVGLMFLIASRNFGLSVGILAALFYCLSPIQFRFTHLARPYALLMVSVLISYGMLFECLKDSSNRKRFLYFLASTFMIYVHPTSIFNVAAQGLIIIFYQRSWKKSLALMLPLAASVAAFGVWMFSIPYFERNDTMWFGPPNWEAVWNVLRVFHAHAAIVLISVVLALLVIFKTRISRAVIDQRSWMAILMWALVPFLMSISFSHMFKPVFQDKYILSVQPAMMLLLAMSIVSLGVGTIRKLLAASVLALMFFSVDLSPHSEGDWRSSVAHVQSKHDNHSMIYLDPWYEFRTFSFYFNRAAYEVPDSTVKLMVAGGATFAWHDVFDTAKGGAQSDVVHMMLAHQGFVDPTVSVQVLDSIATLVEEKEFYGITVRSYRFKPDTLSTIRLQSNDPDSEISVSKENEFVGTTFVPLTNVGRRNILSISAATTFRAEDDLSGVKLVISLERPDGSSAKYFYSDVGSEPMVNGARVAEKNVEVVDFEPDWVVKIYIWNTQQQAFRMSELKVVASS